MKVAAIQLSAGVDKQANIALAIDLVEQALNQGAKIVALPEVFNFRGDTRNKVAVHAEAENVPGPSTEPFLRLAQYHKAFILAGTIFEKAPGGKAYNTSVLINPHGKVIAKYRKIHLFDARLGDKIIKESLCFAAGRLPVAAPLDEFKAGLSVCYDLRFPGLYGQYAKSKANLLFAPSCFTKETGKAHWEVLLRARAIENLSYVIAPNQVGSDFRSVAAYGNSMIVSPWGEVIARGSNDKQEIIYGEISVDQVKKARSTLPGIVK